MIAVPRSDDPRDIYGDLCDLNPKALIATGFEDAYLGYSLGDGIRAVYDYDACIDLLIHKKNFTDEDAEIYLLTEVIPQPDVQGAPVFMRFSP